MKISLERQGTREEKRLKLSLFGDYEFQTKMYGLSGAAGYHPCLYCTATKDDIQRPPPTINEKRTLASLAREHLAFVASGADKKKAKSFKNVINSALLDIEISSCVPPYLHLLLGIVKKHHDLLEKECSELEKRLAYDSAERGVLAIRL